MASCARINATSLQCEHGCCGDTTNQKCCSFELSETVIIVACVVGALIVFSTVIMLVHCITKKKKDAVTPIRHRRRQPRDPDAVRRRRQMVQMPKPPPYTEAPPEYNSWNQTNLVTPTFPSRSGTEHEQTAPSRSSQTRTIRNSPQPSTSGGRALTTISNTRVHTQSDIPIIVASRTSHVVDIPQRQEQDGSHSVSRHGNTPTEEDYRKMARNRHVASVKTSSQDTDQVPKPKVPRSSEPVITSTRPSNRHLQAYSERDTNSVELPGIVGSIQESPPPTNPSAAVRSAQRRAVLVHLQHRRRTQMDFSSSDEDSYV